MRWRLCLTIGAAATLVATACGGGGTESSQAATTTAPETTLTTVAPTTAPPTTAARPSTTRTTVRATTTTARPATTVGTAAATTTTRALTKAEATQALCREIEASVKLVAGGNTLGGGLRLTRAVNTYEGAADATVVSPARRMLSAALAGDLDASASATQEAATACSRLGFPINLPGPIQCVTAPCP